jgi:hypothetical protein
MRALGLPNANTQRRLCGPFTDDRQNVSRTPRAFAAANAAFAIWCSEVAPALPSIKALADRPFFTDEADLFDLRTQLSFGLRQSSHFHPRSFTRHAPARTPACSCRVALFPGAGHPLADRACRRLRRRGTRSRRIPHRTHGGQFRPAVRRAERRSAGRSPLLRRSQKQSRP